MDDIYEARRPSLEQYLEHIRMQPNQVGLACAIDGKTAGVEMFEDTEVFNQFFHKAGPCLCRRGRDGQPHRDDGAGQGQPCIDLLDRVAKIKCDEYKAVGSGKELRFKTGQLNGSALDVDGRVLHFVMLRKNRGQKILMR